MGVTYDNEKQMFVFDFEHDGVEDIVKLTGDGYQVEDLESASTMAMSSPNRWIAVSVARSSSM